MKKYITFLAACAVSVSVYSAQITGGKTTNDKQKLVSGEVNELLAPIGIGDATVYFRWSGNSPQSQIVSKIETNISNKISFGTGVIIDINSATDAVGMDVSSSEEFTLANYHNASISSTESYPFVINNSLGGTTIINANNFLLRQTNPDMAASRISARTNLTINAKYFEISSENNPEKQISGIDVTGGKILKIDGYDDGTGKVGKFVLGKSKEGKIDNVSNIALTLNATLDLSAETEIYGYIAANGKIKINENSTFKDGSELILRSAAGGNPAIEFAEGKTLTMDSGSNLSIGGSVLKSSTSVAINRTFKASQLVLNNANVYVNNASTFTYTRDTTTTELSLNTIQLDANTTANIANGTSESGNAYSKVNVKQFLIGDGATYSGTGGISVENGEISIGDGATVNLKNYGAYRGRFLIKNTGVVFNGTSTLNMGDTGKKIAFVLMGGNSTFNVNGATEIGSLVESTGTLLTINLSNNNANTLKIEALEGFNSSMIVVKNFRDNMIFIGGTPDDHADKFTLLDASGAQLDGRALFVNGWLTLAPAVPEPAEWAAILGALALGIAIYRRRK